MMFSIKDFYSKWDQFRRKLQIWSHSLRKSFMENFIFLCSDTSAWLQQIKAKLLIKSNLRYELVAYSSACLLSFCQLPYNWILLLLLLLSLYYNRRLKLAMTPNNNTVLNIMTFEKKIQLAYTILLGLTGNKFKQNFHGYQNISLSTF